MRSCKLCESFGDESNICTSETVQISETMNLFVIFNPEGEVIYNSELVRMEIAVMVSVANATPNGA